MQTFGPDDLKFTYSADHTPIGTVEVGEVFVVETEDCFTGRFRRPEGFTPENLAWVLENLDGVTGPIAVAGARRGDAVAVTLHRVEVTTVGSTAWSTCEADSPGDWWGEWYACDGLEVRDGYIHLGDLRIAARPLVGCIATAPDRETVLSKMQGRYGGNMDCNEVREGATVVLPVEVDGAYLYFGDSKARMGNGEVVQAPEVGTRLEVSVALGRRPPAMGWPRILSADRLVTVVSARTIDEGAKLAFAEMLAWCTAASGLSRADTAQVLGMLADVGICQVANSLPTACCVVNRAELPWGYRLEALQEAGKGSKMTDNHQKDVKPVTQTPVRDELDAIYPAGEPLPESGPHEIVRGEAASVLREHFRDSADIWVASNRNLYFCEGDRAAVVEPDVLVVSGVASARLDKVASYRTWQHGGSLRFVLEVASEETMRDDVGRKRVVYANIGVAEYWRVDPTGGELCAEILEAERLLDGRWAPIDVTVAEAGGWTAYSASLDLHITWRDDELQFCRPDDDRPLNNLARAEAARRAAEAELRVAETERRAAEAELRAELQERRVAESELRAEIARLTERLGRNGSDGAGGPQDPPA